MAAAALAAGALGAAPSAADPPGAQTVLISRTASGSPADGPSRNAVVSQDRRFGRVVAFESDASDLAPGAAPGVTNVYAALRAGPFPDNGTAWGFDRMVLLSRGLGGQPADGPSTLPAIDGSSRTAPTCVAFVSAASNLVPGDTNGQPDAFVAYLASGRIVRVSVDSAGRQADGPTTQVAVDGRCTRVAFVSAATNLALTRTRRAAWRSARTTAPPAGVREVYVRAIGGPSLQDHALRGLTFLASASNGARAGDGDSFDPVLSPRGRSLGFTSLAGNLGDGPPRGASQVYQRTLDRHLGPRIHGHAVQDMTLRTRLVSEADGRPGNASSSRPAITATGDAFVYQTLATNLLSGATHGVSQIVETTVDGSTRRHAWISSRASGLGDGASVDATVSDGGDWVFYETRARNLRPRGDANPAAEVLLDAFPWVISADGAGRPLPTDSHRPDTSPHGNYVVFESGGMVLLRWLGPK
jgi:hypothetical protein